MNDIYPRSVGVNQASICLVILTIFCHYEVFSLMEIVPLTALSKICLQLWLLKLRTICFNLFERPPAVSLGQSEPWSWPEPASQLTTLSVLLLLSLSLSLLAGAESGGGAGAEGGKPGGSRAGVRFLRRGEREVFTLHFQVGGLMLQRICINIPACLHSSSWELNILTKIKIMGLLFGAKMTHRYQ